MVFVADCGDVPAGLRPASVRLSAPPRGPPLLFAIPRLADTAQAILDRGNAGGFAVFDAKAFTTASGFGMPSQRDRLAETVRRLAEGSSWLEARSVNEVDPAYSEVLHQIIRDVSELTGRDLAAGNHLVGIDGAHGLAQRHDAISHRSRTKLPAASVG